MNEPMTDTRLAEIQARADAANPLPWCLVPVECPEHGQHYDLHGGPSYPGDDTRWWLDGIVTHPGCEHGQPLDEANAEFLVNARTDIPDLLAEIERLRGACNNPDFTCLSGEYCDGCQASDQADAAKDSELAILRKAQKKHEDELDEIRQENVERATALIGAVEALHAQAHGPGTGLMVCPLEPCRSLYRHLPNPAEAVST